MALKRTFFQLIFFLPFISGAFASNLFWVGGSGNWSDKSHWSEKSGGVSGASVPAKNDDVFFDNNSFSTEGEFILIEKFVECRDLYLLNGIINCNNQTFSCRSIFRTKNKSALIFNFSKIIVQDGWKLTEELSKSIFSEKNLSSPFSSANLKGGNVNLPFSTTTDTCIIGSDTLIVVITAIDPKCNSDCNGSASVVVSGGTPPYTYSWSPGGYTVASVTGLCANNYLIEIWDNTGVNYCPVNAVITNPLVLNGNISPLFPVTSCSSVCDGSATASGVGGTSPYTYSWCNGQTTATATGLCAGSCTVLISDANGCTKVKTTNITSPPPLVANGSSTTINCFGICNGSACVTPSGGSPPYTYSWAPVGSTTSCITGLCAGNYTCYISDTKTCTATYINAITSPPALTITLTGTNILCSGVCTGSVTATVSGGVPPYNYSWSNGCATSACTGLCAGNYTLTLTDGNGCIKTATVAITQPAPLTLSITKTNVPCFGQCSGTATATVAGGTTPYTYSWSPSGGTSSTATGLCAGTYTLNITDANGCTKSGTVTITQPPLLTVTGSATNISCNGMCNGSVAATAGGGTPPYTYAWSNGCSTSTCSGLCAGNYTITVADSKTCTATATITVTQPLPLSPNISSTPATCNGICDGSVSSSPTGGTSPYTYLWTLGGYTTSTCTGLCAGTYTLNLTDANGCVATSTVSITQPSILITSISASPNPLNCNGDCNGTAVTSVSGGTPTYTYAWSNGPTTPSITGLCAGTYSVAVTDANGCTASASVLFLQPPTLTVLITSSNPTCSGNCNGSISAVAAGGTPVYTFNWLPGGQTTSTISSQCAGNFTLTTTDSKGCSNTQTITLTDPGTLAANASVVNNISCSGVCDGSATSVPTGGTAPYTYLWTGGQTTATATGFCAGSYSVTVTDANGCTDIDNLTITQPTALTSAVSNTTSSCTFCNGTATVTSSGGTPSYTYLWTPSGQTNSVAIGLCTGTYTVDVSDANGCINTLTVSINPVVTLTITVSGTSVSCFGSCDGIATATPFGGGVPYTYSWSTTPVQTTQSGTGLCAGTYSVTVGDSNGCLAASIVTLTNPTALTNVMNSTTASCGLCNGTATSTPSGGTGAYTYSWNIFPLQTTATATGLCAGNFTVTVNDANNCPTTTTVTIGNIPAIANNASTTLATCGVSDGAICVSPSGGTPGYTYTWMPGGATTACVTGLASGIYTVTISDAGGCSTPFQIPLSNISGPTVAVTFSVNPTCNASCDGSISVSVAGANPPFTYLWNPSGQTTTSATGLCAGTDNLQVIDAVLCTTFLSVTLVDPVQLSSNPTITNVSCNGGNDGNICLAPSGGNSPYTFTWSPGGQTTSCITGLTAGTYSVIITDNTGCDDTLAIPISDPALLTVTISATNVTCNGSNNGTATATASGGTTLYTYLWMPGGAPIPPIVGLSPGAYTVTVTDANGCTATASVIITQPGVLTSTITLTNITCDLLCDGTATLNASGGTTAYSYLWNTTPNQTTSVITGLCVGNYVVNLTDANGCANTQSVNITQPAALSAAVSTTTVNCFGGSDGTATATVSGGTGSYTYLWSPSAQTTTTATGLSAGSYTLNVNDTNGCGVNQFFSITEPLQLQANITNTSPTCFGGCDGTATSNPVGGTGAYTYSWNTSPIQTTATATGLCSGSYTLTLSDGNACSINQPVTIAAPPALGQSNGVAPATCMLCNGSISVVAFGGTPPYSFLWSNGETTATITGLCAGVYIDTVMDTNGCISVDTIGLSNTTGPTLSLCSTNALCFGNCDGTADVCSATGDGPPWIYLWFPGNQTTQSITALCPLQYFVNVTDSNGCITVDNVNITEPAQLASNAAITNATCFGICNGSITLAPTGGTGAFTYSWMPGALTTQNISSQCAGNYTLTLTDANNCVLTSTLTIGQNTILTSTVTSTNNSCNASCNGTANVAVGGGSLPYIYLWSPTNQTTSAATGLCDGTNTITVTDAAGCVRIDSAVITQPAVLATGITAVNPLCTSLCNGSLSAVPTGGTPPYTYLWNPGGATTSSITGLCAGNYTLSITDTNNCSSTTTVTLTDPPLISLTDVVMDASCANICDGTINITPIGGTGVYTFIWSPGGQITEDISGLCPGIDSVTITDANGCSFTDSMTIGVTTVVIAAGGNDTSYCVGGIAALCSGSINADSIHWYQLPAWIFIGNTNCINQNPPVGVTSYGLIAFNSPCSDTDTVVVTVNVFPILVSSNDTSICAGDSATLCTAGANNYQWYTLPLWTPLATGNCITVSPAVGSTCYGIIGLNGVCGDTDTVCVIILAMPIANAGNDVSFCAGGSTQLCDTLSMNEIISTWYTLPFWTPLDTDSCTIVAPVVSMDYAVIVSNGICSDTDTVTVTVYPLPIVDAGTSVTILLGGSTALNGTGNGNYFWTPATGLSCTTCANPTANPTITTTYTLVVTDTTGCVGWDTVRATIVSDIIVNDGLSPNGDGINDVWTISNIESFPNCVVEVYNRWGELLFNSTGYKTKWDATYNSKQLPVGTYYYVINLNSDLHPDPITGPITILR